MSFAINWELLSDGEAAEKFRSWLNERFQEIERPAFLGQLYVSELDFGDIPPSIEISDITDPIPEFYLPDDFDIYSQSASNLNLLIQSLSKGYGGDEIEPSQVGKQPSDLSQDFPIQPASAQEPPLAAYGTLLNSEHLVEDLIIKHAETMKRETDMQVEITVDYKGNMRMSVSTELIVNQPTPAFMVLPLSLTLTGFSFKEPAATAMISYLGDRINFCFKEPADNERIFKEIAIDSEVGDRDRQVLKNVSKIEKFVVEQVRELVSRHLVYPNYHCLSLIPDETFESEGDSVNEEFETQS
ncbi:Mitochondrial distribution and morphology protein 12 [Phlyctochytrium planicorne]|nr:Mitochondrial distribution and morphology protein 12 [Phlyctochytrium planicorne]